MAKTQPTERTLQHLGKDGWLPDVTEKWVPVWRNGEMVPHGKRKDLFGVVDVIALPPLEEWSEPPKYIQVTSAGGLSARIKKMQTETFEKAARLARNPHITLELWGWEKLEKEKREELGMKGGRSWYARHIVVTWDERTESLEFERIGYQ